jgi:hypothetical protein
MRWIGGFEGADHVNGHGISLAMPVDSGHLDRLGRDYRRLRLLGFTAVRESLGWRTSESPHGFDLRSLHMRMRAAERHGLQVRWTLMHYGVPAGLDLLDGDEGVFVERFARFCAAVARALVAYPSPTPRVYTPINEISFLTWAATSTGLLHPCSGDRPHDGGALKARLVRAGLAGCAAIRQADPGAAMLWVEPLVHVRAPDARSALRQAALREHAAQFEALDMLTGRSDPALGGDPACVDLIGVNYYHSNQWEHATRDPLHWHLDHPLRRPLSRMLRELHDRYRLPITLSETSHVGEGRAAWLRDLVRQVAIAHDNGIPIEAICLYPVVHVAPERPVECRSGRPPTRSPARPGLRPRLRRGPQDTRRPSPAQWNRTHEPVTRLLAPALGFRLSAPATPDVALRPALERDVLRRAGPRP